ERGPRLWPPWLCPPRGWPPPCCPPPPWPPPEPRPRPPRRRLRLAGPSPPAEPPAEAAAAGAGTESPSWGLRASPGAGCAPASARGRLTGDASAASTVDGRPSRGRSGISTSFGDDEEPPPWFAPSPSGRGRLRLRPPREPRRRGLEPGGRGVPGWSDRSA